MAAGQGRDGCDPSKLGIELFLRIIEAFRSVAGHMLSDVATSAGLPPLIFGLLQFFQRGGIGDHSISDIARAMYRSGYDFRHFLSAGITVAIIEVFVRTAWTVRELSDGKRLMDAMPIESSRLQSALFLSHTVATAVNAGKVAIIQNPLSINWAQWMAFFRYILPQANWLVVGRADAEAAFVREKLAVSWDQLYDELASLWGEVFGPDFHVVL